MCMVKADPHSNVQWAYEGVCMGQVKAATRKRTFVWGKVLIRFLPNRAAELYETWCGCSS